MAPGVWSFRRSRRLVIVLVTAAGVLSMGHAPSAMARERHVGTALTVGEDGSGPPPVPVVLPRSVRRGASAFASAIRFSDLTSSDAWAKQAIRYVAGTNAWMRDFSPAADGSYAFRPDRLETRKYFARSVVEAFAPDEVPDPSMVLSDVDPASVWYPYVTVAVHHGWLAPSATGSFRPDDPVSMATVHHALVLALGLKRAAVALNHIHTTDGTTFAVPANFGTTLLGMRLGLRYNAPTGKESMDVAPFDDLSRAQVAYSLFHAATQPSWNIDGLLAQYQDVELPHLGPRRTALVRWGIRFVGYPYVWGGEWGLESPEPAALGGQPRSGFDCSGLTWWLLRADDGSAWKVAPPRPYAGWALAQRTSAEMASRAPHRLTFRQLRPGDIMFYDGDGDGVTDHVDTYIGNGYSLDSSSTPGGVTLMWVASGWYRDHFLFGRRVLPLT
jgi:cell wall-associated NlpC family hydrolase